jgi:small subunit ribosomal protein S20
MANIKAMKKDLRRNAKARTVNTGIKSALKTFVKKAKAAGTAETVVSAQKALDKAAVKGVIHPNQAARRKSRMMKAANKAAAK